MPPTSSLPPEFPIHSSMKQLSATTTFNVQQFDSILTGYKLGEVLASNLSITLCPLPSDTASAPLPLTMSNAHGLSVPPEAIKPTYVGYIRTTRDVCLLIELVLGSQLQHIPRRPHERERQEIIKSGNVFIYSEDLSGVKRWTDGLNWSPSRVLGNFLIYREVEPGYPGDGRKKVALKNRPPRGAKPTGIQKRASDLRSALSQPQACFNWPRVNNSAGTPSGTCPPDGENELSNLEDRELLGSLTDSYPFLDDGLIKKTISLTVQGVAHHVVSYYRPSHVRSGALKTPTMDPRFAGILPRADLIRNSGLRVPLEQEEYRINENSDAYITHAQAAAAQAAAQQAAAQQAAAQSHGLYQPPQAYQQQQLYQAQTSQYDHGLSDNGLPAVGVPGMASPFDLPPQASTMFPDTSTHPSFASNPQTGVYEYWSGDAAITWSCDPT